MNRIRFILYSWMKEHPEDFMVEKMKENLEKFLNSMDNNTEKEILQSIFKKV